MSLSKLSQLINITHLKTKFVVSKVVKSRDIPMIVVVLIDEKPQQVEEKY